MPEEEKKQQKKSRRMSETKQDENEAIKKKRREQRLRIGHNKLATTDELWPEAGRQGQAKEAEASHKEMSQGTTRTVAHWAHLLRGV